MHNCVNLWSANLCLPGTGHLFGLDYLEVISRNRGDESRDDETDYGQDTHCGCDECIKIEVWFGLGLCCVEMSLI